MRIITGGRRGGKTTALIDAVRRAKDAGASAVFLASSEAEAARLRHDYPDVEFRVAGQQGWWGRHYDFVVLDNLELYLAAVLGTTVHLASMTTEEKP